MIRKQRWTAAETPATAIGSPTAIDHTLDRNVDPNEVYHYGIYAIYKMSDGRLFPSPGVVVSARPQPPVSALEAPRLLLEPGPRCPDRLDRAGAWLGQDPAHGRSPARPGRHPAPSGRGRGARGPSDRAGRPDRAYDPEPPAEGHCYYTPLTVWNGTCTPLGTVWPSAGWRTRPSFARLAPAADSAAVPAEFGSRFAGGGPRKQRHVGRRPPRHSPTGPNDPDAITETVSADYDRQMLDASLPDPTHGAAVDTQLDRLTRHYQPAMLALGTSGFTA